MKWRSIPVTLAGDLKIEHTLLYHEDVPADKLLVILPGRGYFCSHPVLHYLGKMVTLNGYDVLQVSYSFQVIPNLTVSNPQLAQEVQLALSAVLTPQYWQLCIAGKSLGTPLAASAIHDLDVQDKSLILLTPIGGSVSMVGEVRTLAIIGTVDDAYNAAQVAQDAGKWVVYEGLNHGLEYPGDWRKSVEILPQIIETCERFLRG